MKKRLLALIGVIVVLASALIIPVGAETNDQVTCSPLSFYLSVDLRPVYSWSSFLFIDGPVLVSGKMSSSASVSPGENFSYTVDNIRFTVDSNGYIRAYFYVPGSSLNTSPAFTQNGPSRFSVRPVVDSSSAGVVESISFSYSLSDVVSFIPFLCDSWGFFYPSLVSQDDLDQARQEGYQEGYQEGIQSADGYQEGVEAGRQEGYQEGYDAGVEAGRQDGYTEGVEVGRQEGYTQGVTAGLQQAADVYDAMNVHSIWEMSQLRVSYSYNYGASVTLDSVPFDVTDSGTVSFVRTCDYILSRLGTGADLSLLTIDSISFEWASDRGVGVTWDWVDGVPIYASVPSSFSWDLSYSRYDPSGNEPSGSVFLQPFNGRMAFVPDGTFLTDSIRYIQLGIAVCFEDSFTGLRSLSLSTDIKISAEGYNAGYVAGYADGTAVVAGPLVDESYEKGYGSGYVLGFSNGKKEGLQISDTGDWRHLMLAVVEAPINTFQSLFNFEILGLDMRAAFGSMMGLCVLLIILKKVL